MQTKTRPLLVVTDKATSINIPAKNDIVLITGINRIFPAIFELQPVGIVLDYDYMGSEMEKTLRRIRSNPFYSKLKIYCYKPRLHTKVDGLLQALGVQQFIYAEDARQIKTATSVKLLNTIFENAISKKMAKASIQ
jgi:hypothetical protein